MNETGHNTLPAGLRSLAGGKRASLGAVAAALVAAFVWVVLGGCADPRTEPSRPSDSGFTETIVLWQNQPVGPDGHVAATFNVDAELAPVNRPGLDTPARLTVVVYIEPDCQILRREQIMDDSLGYYQDSVMTPQLVELTSLKDQLTQEQKDTVAAIENRIRAFAAALPMTVDSSVLLTTFPGPRGTVTCDTAIVGYGFDPAANPVSAADLAALQAMNPRLAEVEAAWAHTVLDTFRLGAERDYLGRILDNRYTLAIALDDTSRKRYPEAVYSTELAGALAGQGIYAARTDTASNLKGRGFDITLSQFSAADVVNLGEALEVNWVTCFPGGAEPCLGVGQHTLHAWVTGRDPRLTGTLVLTYAEERP